MLVQYYDCQSVNIVRREIITFYFENRRKCTNAICGQNTGLYNVTAGGTKRNYCSLKCWIIYHSNMNFLFETYSLTHRAHSWLIPFTSGFKTYHCLSGWNSCERCSALSLYRIILLKPNPNINVKHPNEHGLFNPREFFNVTRRKWIRFRHHVSPEEEVNLEGVQSRNFYIWQWRHPVSEKICLRKPNTMVIV
jgi:hypothetical protein